MSYAIFHTYLGDDEMIPVKPGQVLVSRVLTTFFSAFTTFSIKASIAVLNSYYIATTLSAAAVNNLVVHCGILIVRR